MSNQVLIIDDDPDLTLGVAVRLEANGYDVIAAPDAITGLSRVRNENPDLVILDLGLPGGGGLTLLERLRTKLEDTTTPVVVLTARDTSVRDEAIARGANDFFQKPVDPDVLLDAIGYHVGPAAGKRRPA